MHITEALNQDQTLAAMRDVRTLVGRTPVYANASITIRSFWPAELSPTALYVLQSKLDRVSQTAEEFNRAQVNLFGLYSVYQMGEHLIAPPVVEYSAIDDAYLIVDGIHRVHKARESRSQINCIFVSGVNADLPVIGMPVAWNQVMVRDVLPSNPQERRSLRRGLSDDLRMYFRDYRFLGSTGRRPVEGELG